MNTWYMIGGQNIQAQYAYGTETQAQRFADVQNAGKDVNFVHVYEVSDADIVEFNLENNDEAFDLDEWEREYQYQLDAAE